MDLSSSPYTAHYGSFPFLHSQLVMGGFKEGMMRSPWDMLCHEKFWSAKSEYIPEINKAQRKSLRGVVLVAEYQARNLYENIMTLANP